MTFPAPFNEDDIPGLPDVRQSVGQTAPLIQALADQLVQAVARSLADTNRTLGLVKSKLGRGIKKDLIDTQKGLIDPFAQRLQDAARNSVQDSDAELMLLANRLGQRRDRGEFDALRPGGVEATPRPGGEPSFPPALPPAPAPPARPGCSVSLGPGLPPVASGVPQTTPSGDCCWRTCLTRQECDTTRVPWPWSLRMSVDGRCYLCHPLSADGTCVFPGAGGGGGGGGAGGGGGTGGGGGGPPPPVPCLPCPPCPPPPPSGPVLVGTPECRVGLPPVAAPQVVYLARYLEDVSGGVPGGDSECATKLVEDAYGRLFPAAELVAALAHDAWDDAYLADSLAAPDETGWPPPLPPGLAGAPDDVSDLFLSER